VIPVERERTDGQRRDARVEKVAVAGELRGRHALVGPEDALHAVHPRVGDRGTRHRARVEAHGIEALLVLAPADRPDEALVADRDLLPAEPQDRLLRAAVLQPRLVEVRALGIGDHRVLDEAVARVVVVRVADRLDVVELQESRESPHLAAREVEPDTERAGVGRFRLVVLLDVLEPVAQVQCGLALLDEVARAFARGRQGDDSHQQQDRRSRHDKPPGPVAILGSCGPKRLDLRQLAPRTLE
jgi:hypothetical protein